MNSIGKLSNFFCHGLKPEPHQIRFDKKNNCLLLFSIEISNIDFVLNENIFNELFKSLIDPAHSCFNSHGVQCLYITK